MNRPRQLSGEEEITIVDRFINTNDSIKTISDDHNTTDGTIRNILNRYGVVIPLRKLSDY